MVAFLQQRGGGLVFAEHVQRRHEVEDGTALAPDDAGAMGDVARGVQVAHRIVHLPGHQRDHSGHRQCCGQPGLVVDGAKDLDRLPSVVARLVEATLQECAARNPVEQIAALHARLRADGVECHLQVGAGFGQLAERLQAARARAEQPDALRRREARVGQPLPQQREHRAGCVAARRERRLGGQHVDVQRRLRVVVQASPGGCQRFGGARRFGLHAVGLGAGDVRCDGLLWIRLQRQNAIGFCHHAVDRAVASCRSQREEAPAPRCGEVAASLMVLGDPTRRCVGLRQPRAEREVDELAPFRRHRCLYCLREEIVLEAVVARPRRDALDDAGVQGGLERLQCLPCAERGRAAGQRDLEVVFDQAGGFEQALRRLAQAMDARAIAACTESGTGSSR